MAKDILKDIAIRNAKPRNKDCRLNDGEGLYVLIKTKTACLIVLVGFMSKK